jgi:hypothetical protein
MMNILDLGFNENKFKPFLKMATQRVQIAVNKKTNALKVRARGG